MLNPPLYPFSGRISNEVCAIVAHSMKWGKTMTRIERIRVYEVIVPGKAGAINSPSMGSFLSHEWDLLPICLLEVEFSDGVVGLGEVGRGLGIKEIEAWVKPLVGMQLRGMTPANLPDTWKPLTIWGGVLEEAHPAPHAHSPSPLWHALEMIALDAMGKRLGCPVVDLIGGGYRDHISVDYWCGRQTPQDLRRSIGEAVALGFTGIKMKSKLGDPVQEQVATIREVGGANFSITIDPMYQWFSPHEALHLLKGLEAFGGGVRVEDPFPEDRPEFWRRARQVCSVPLVWHARSLASLRRALQENCADAYNCSGGARDFLTQAHAVEVAGYSCWRGSSLELGVAQAYGLHLASAARCCVMASDFQSAVIRQSMLVQEKWQYEAGTLAVPSGAGIGVTLDREALRHYLKAEAEYTL